MVIINEAPVAFRLLNGLFCVYKPAGVTTNGVRQRVLGNLSRELCELKCRPPSEYVAIEGDAAKSLTVDVGPNYADLPEVIGPRYLAKDFKCQWATHIGKRSSGVFLLAIGDKGIKSAFKFDSGRPLRVYHVSGKLGLATEDCFLSENSRIVEKATFKSVKRSGLDRILATVQATHQRQVFQQIGIDPQSQAAYELAVQGPIRPVSRKIPVLYGLKCIEFNSPDFIVEVHCINETEDFLARILLDVAMKHHTLAACTKIRCIRQGPFTFHDALLSKHWTLENILNSMIKCKEILDLQPKTTPHLAPLVDKSSKHNDLSSG